MQEYGSMAYKRTEFDVEKQLMVTLTYLGTVLSYKYIILLLLLLFDKSLIHLLYWTKGIISVFFLRWESKQFLSSNIRCVLNFETYGRALVIIPNEID